MVDCINKTELVGGKVKRVTNVSDKIVPTGISVTQPPNLQGRFLNFRFSSNVNSREE